MKKADYNIECEKNKLDKKCPPALFSIEVHFYYAEDGHLQKSKFGRWFVANQSWNECRVFRETVFTHGIFWDLGNGRGEVIFPTDLFRIKIDVQPKGWKEFIEGPAG